MENLPTNEYLNLDLVCKSKQDLTPLIEHFGDKVFVLCNDEVEDGYYVVLESEALDVSGYFPEGHARDIIDLINSLPDPLQVLWHSCDSKVFDFGFRSGLAEGSYSAELSQGLLKDIASLGASVSITIYPAEVLPEVCDS
jgi:hypothetical protein